VDRVRQRSLRVATAGRVGSRRSTRARVSHHRII
jgi:hypothetical protein